MSTKDYSTKLLEMEGVRIENLEESEKEIVLQISLERRTQICRHCGAETERVHDYRIRQVRDLELRGKPLRLLYRRRRYVCPVCGKRFAEQNTFVGRYMRFTHRTGEKIMTLLRRRSSMKDAAKDAGVSISGVQRVLKRLCSKNSVNATSVTKSEISRFRSRRPLPPDPYCSAPTQPPLLAAAWPWQVIGKNAKLNRRRDTFVSEISEFRHRRRD